MKFCSLYRYLSGRKCVIYCPEGQDFYIQKNTGINYCLPCHSECHCCNGPSNTQCWMCKHYKDIDACVEKCPNNRPMIYQQQCRSVCPLLEYNGKCVDDCGPDRFEYNGTCVEECPLHSKYIRKRKCSETCNGYLNGNYCEETCPNQLELIYNNTCVDKCPESHSIVENRHCVDHCAGFLYQSQCLRKCPGVLPHLKGRCMIVCPKSHPYIDPISRQCTDDCSGYIFDGKCVLKCPPDTYINETSCRQCHDQCKTIYYFPMDRSRATCHGPTSRDCTVCKQFRYQGVCVKKCENAYRYTVAGSKECFAGCPPGKASWPNSTLCLDLCTINGISYYKFNSTCVKECPSSEPFVFNRTCHMSCPNETAMWLDSFSCMRKCVLNNITYFNFNGICVRKCPQIAPFSAKGKCFRKCPQGMLRWYDSTICTNDCKHNGTLFYNASGRCVIKCPSSAPYTDEQGNCLTQCPHGTVWWPDTKKCKANCYRNKTQFFKINGTCVTECPPNMQYIVKDDHECLDKCPGNMSWWPDHKLNMCQ